jgi:hypothetical protein
MPEIPRTPFSDVVNILSELCIDYRNEESVKDPLEIGDLAFSLAYATSEGLIESSPIAWALAEIGFSGLCADRCAVLTGRSWF